MALLIGTSSQYVKQILRKPSLASVLIPLFRQSTRIDAINAFTNNLVEEQEIKWKLSEIKVLKKIRETNALKNDIVVAAKGIATDIKSVSQPSLEVDVRKLNCDQLDSLILSSLDSQQDTDFFYLINQCLKWELLPSVETTLKSLHRLSLLGKVEIIYSISAVMERCDEETYKKYLKLAPFKAVALWKNGSLGSTLELLLNCYHSPITTSNRKVLWYALSLISEETLKFKSEAVLVSLIKLAKEINQEFRDIFLTGRIWKNCFESEWFSDQQVACKLFEECPELRDAVYNRTSSLCYGLLTEDRVDVVHRLIELLLKHNKKDECKVCLNILFEYNYCRKDLRACGEIIRSSLELDIQLGEDKSRKLLNLLLNKPFLLVQKPSVKKFQYKF